MLRGHGKTGNSKGTGGDPVMERVACILTECYVFSSSYSSAWFILFVSCDGWNLQCFKWVLL